MRKLRKGNFFKLQGKFKIIFGLMWICSITGFSQQPVTNVTTTNTPATAASYTVNSQLHSWGEGTNAWGDGDNLILEGFEVGANSYSLDQALDKSIIIKRVDNGIVVGD